MPISDETLAARRSNFHERVIGRRTFVALMTSWGPYLKMVRKGHKHWGPTVAIGPAFIDRGSDGKLHAFKYDHHQSHFELDGLTAEQAVQVAKEFGVEIGRMLAHEVGLPADWESRSTSIYESPSWQSLKEWVRKHPRISADYGRRGVDEWLERARQENQTARAAA